MQKIEFTADYVIVDERGTHLPHRIALATMPITDEGWFANNNISIEYDTSNKSATISLSDIDAEIAGTSYVHDILDDYFVHMEPIVEHNQPKLKFIEAKTKPEGSGLSEEEFKKQMKYFDNALKDKIETYFEQAIKEIAFYLESNGHEVKEWD